MLPDRGQPLGIVLAGGAGRRLAGAKASIRLGDRPLIAWPLQALAAALSEVVIVAKEDTILPELGPVEVRREPPEPRHPFCGVLTGLALAAGRPVLVCPLDLPFVTPELVAALRDAPVGSGEPVVVRGAPLLGRYGPGCEPALSAAVARGRSVQATLRELRAREWDATDADWTMVNVNTAEDLAAARARLAPCDGGAG